MSHGALKFPVQHFLRSLIPPFESSRTEFVQKIGYNNLEAGRLHLDSWLDRGEGYDVFLKRLAGAFPDHAADLEKAIAETAEMRAAEGDPGWRARCKAEEASFVPYVHVVGDTTVPRGITMFGMTGGHGRWTTIHIPESILRLPIEEQLAALPELMRAYLVEYRSACPFFGMVTGFLYVRLQDYYRFKYHGKVSFTDAIDSCERMYQAKHNFARSSKPLPDSRKARNQHRIVHSWNLHPCPHQSQRRQNAQVPATCQFYEFLRRAQYRRFGERERHRHDGPFRSMAAVPTILPRPPQVSMRR